MHRIGIAPIAAELMSALAFALCGAASAADPQVECGPPGLRQRTEGYHTYRIPALIVTRNGALLAFCEGRKNSRSDTGRLSISSGSGRPTRRDLGRALGRVG